MTFLSAEFRSIGLWRACFSDKGNALKLKSCGSCYSSSSSIRTDTTETFHLCHQCQRSNMKELGGYLLLSLGATEVKTSKLAKSLQKRNIMVVNMENKVIFAAFLKDKSDHPVTKSTETTLNNSICKNSRQCSQTLILAPHN